jgi:phosphoribosylamine---glycine ligase
MKVLVIGSGGREHALVWKIGKSPLVNKVFCAPGNAGIARDCQCVPIAAQALDELLQFAVKEKIDLTVVGPEAPLVNGIVDLFTDNGLKIFGPSQKAAELEGSKAFAKYIMKQYHIPTADYQVFDDLPTAQDFVNRAENALVIKADGLAAGKGVVVCSDRHQAREALEMIKAMQASGVGGGKIIIEECLVGEEVSVLALVDGENLVCLAPAQDHKRIFDNDQGLNTGGMGAYAPVPFVSESMMTLIKRDILEPTVRGMALEGRPYKGVLYAGLMLTEDGPKVLEYNCRFGDPETQVILPLAQSDLVEALLASVDGNLKNIKWRNYKSAAVTVVIASGGYPNQYQTGKPIFGVEGSFGKDVKVFHSGTQISDQQVVTAGGRVLAVTALASQLPLAIERAYAAVGKITFDGAYYRKDIGAKALPYLK